MTRSRTKLKGVENEGMLVSGSLIGNRSDVKRVEQLRSKQKRRMKSDLRRVEEKTDLKREVSVPVDGQ